MPASGEDGDAFFKSVDTSNPNYVIITLNDADSTLFTLPREDAGGILDQRVIT
ncbi:MAG: hypothetical protein R3Y15_01910 [Rikenellaceae bacterium]